MPDLIYEIKVVFKNNDVDKIIFLDGTPTGQPGSDVTPGDIQKYKKSPYGLRFVESVSYTQQAESATKCYMIIGGYKVQVPCS